MIEEIPLRNFSYDLKNSTLNYPQCNCGECPRMYFNLLSIASRGQGKTYNIVKLCKHYEQNILKDNDNLIHPLRVILISPTVDANPIFNQLKSLDKEDIYSNYSDELLQGILDKIKEEKEETKEYNEYVQAYKKAVSIPENKVIDFLDKNPDIFEILNKHNFESPSEIPQPKYKVSPVVIIVLDDLLASGAFSMKPNSVLTNAIIKNRHLGVCFAILAQSCRSIPKNIRLNCSVFFLGKFASKKIILDDLYETVSNVLTPEQFEEIYDKATEEKYGSLIIDCTGKEKRFYKGLDAELFIKNNVAI